MKRNVMSKKRCGYNCPLIEVFIVKTEYLLVEGSGQHGNIGQGGSYESAKAGHFYNEEEDASWEWDTNN